MKLKLIIALSLTFFVLAGCSHTRKVNVDEANKSAALEVAKQPIYSTNLIKKEIPESLKKLTKVYQPPENCAQYSQELSTLDSVLGEDLVENKHDSNKAVTLHLGQILGSQVESNIPFNSVIKSLSGAKKHEKARISAFLKGQSRRSFLKGWGASQGCSAKHPEKIPSHGS